MNILRIADGVSGLFPQKVAVTLIHSVRRSIIGKVELNNDILPEVFNKPLMLDLNGTNWRIMEAETVKNGSYFRRKKIVLHVKEPDPGDFLNLGRYCVPTKVLIDPETSTQSLFHDFTIRIAQEDWCQLEFLPVSSLPNIQEELAQIEAILALPSNALLGYETIHVREKMAPLSLNIPLNDFCTFLTESEKGNIAYGGKEYVKNGIAVSTDNYVYYGEVEDGIISKIAIQQFDSMDDELAKMLVAFDLLLVDWCNARIVSSQVDEKNLF